MSPSLKTEKSSYTPAGERIFSFGSAQKYTGIHLVWAVPMKLGDYNILRGWNIPKNENPEEDGYLIEVINTKPNVLGFDGAVTWKTVEVFHASYSEGQIIRQTTHGERMFKEISELTDKVEKLGIFVKGDTFKSLEELEQYDMLEQLKSMREYLWFLSKRIARLSGQRK